MQSQPQNDRRRPVTWSARICNQRLPVRYDGQMDTEALIRRYFDAVNGEDWSALESVWHPDGEMRAP